MAMRFYNTRTDASNNEYLEAGFDTNVAYLRTVANGTGTGRPLNINTDAAALTIFTSTAGALDLYAGYTNRGRITLQSGSSGTQIQLSGNNCGSITLGDGVWNNPNSITQGDTLTGSSGTDVHYNMTPD